MSELSTERGSALIALIGIPLDDAKYLSGMTAVKDKWIPDIRSYLLGAGAQQLSYALWFERPKIAVFVGINPTVNGLVVNGASLSTIDNFSYEGVPPSIDLKSIERGASVLQGITGVAHASYDVYRNNITGQTGLIDDSSGRATVVCYEFAGIPVGPERTQYIHGTDLVADGAHALMGSVPVDGSYTKTGSIGFDMIVTHTVPVLDEPGSYVVINGPTLIERAEFTPKYYWIVATAGHVADAIGNTLKYITDRNDRAKVQRQVDLMRARGDDLLGIGWLDPTVNPYHLLNETRQYASDMWDSAELAETNGKLRAALGTPFPINVNVSDDKDCLSGLVSGTGPIHLTVSSASPPVVTSSTGDVMDLDTWSQLIPIARSLGRAVDVSWPVDQSHIDAQLRDRINASLTSEVPAYSSLVGDGLADKGFFGRAFFGWAMNPVIDKNYELVFQLFNTAGAGPGLF